METIDYQDYAKKGSGNGLPLHELMAEAFKQPILEALARPADFVIHRDEKEDYLYRWWLSERTKGGSVYLHLYLNGDENEQPHDHPWDSMSVCLVGGYIEEIFANDIGTVTRRLSTREVSEGQVIFRGQNSIHRILRAKPGTMTLFFTGQVVKPWGFFERGAFTPAADAVEIWSGPEGSVHSKPKLKANE